MDTQTHMLDCRENKNSDKLFNILIFEELSDQQTLNKYFIYEIQNWKTKNRSFSHLENPTLVSNKCLLVL